MFSAALHQNNKPFTVRTVLLNYYIIQLFSLKEKMVPFMAGQGIKRPIKMKRINRD